MQRHRSLYLTLLSFGWLSCSNPACPSGTGLDGSTCRRLATSSKSDPSAAEPRADAGEGLDRAGSRAEPAEAGGGDRDAGTSGDGSAASGGGRSGSGAAPSSEPTAGTSAGSRSASGGSGGSTLDHAAPTAGRSSSPSIGTPAGGKGGSGGASGAGSSAAGTGGTAAGRGGASAGVGGGAGRGGAGAPAAGTGSADLPSGDWFCVQVDQACSCVAGQGVSGDTCSAPKPPCCFTLLTVRTQNCQCWPSDSAECADAGSGSDSKKVASCPPG